jgi:hypothetical protein
MAVWACPSEPEITHQNASSRQLLVTVRRPGFARFLRNWKSANAGQYQASPVLTSSPLVKMRVTYPIEGTKAEERWKLLSLRHLPARLNAEEAGWLLGFTKEEITSLWPRRFSSLSEIQASNGRNRFRPQKSSVSEKPRPGLIKNEGGDPLLVGAQSWRTH